jgi:hypothetical protein
MTFYPSREFTMEGRRYLVQRMPTGRPVVRRIIDYTEGPVTDPTERCRVLQAFIQLEHL